MTELLIQWDSNTTGLVNPLGCDNAYLDCLLALLLRRPPTTCR